MPSASGPEALELRPAGANGLCMLRRSLPVGRNLVDDQRLEPLAVILGVLARHEVEVPAHVHQLP